jgi:hypothetical protein
VTRLRDGQQRSAVRFQVGGRQFFLTRVHTSSRVHSAPYPMDTGGNILLPVRRHMLRESINLLLLLLLLQMSRNISVGIATGYGLDGRGSISGRLGKFSPLHSVQTGSGAHPGSYPVGTGGDFSVGKAAGV